MKVRQKYKITYSIGFGDLDELIDSLGIIWVLVWMFFSRKFSVCFFHLSNCGLGSHTQNFVWNEGFQRFDVLHNIEALICKEPHEGNE